MASPASDPVKTWFQEYSQRLASSFRSAGQLRHAVTKGQARELQIVDFLQKLLPTRATLQSRVVIADSTGQQSSQFDAVLFDRTNWPLLYAQEGTVVAMVESVLAALEVKSRLGVREIQDIANKAASLHRLATTNGALRPVLVTAFGYQCDNLNLAFYDYATSCVPNSQQAVTAICVLNQGILLTCQRDADRLVPAWIVGAGSVPTMAECGLDSLLMYVYFLSDVASMGGRGGRAWLHYGRSLLNGASVRYFDDDYLQRVCRDDDARRTARGAYLRAGNRTFAEVYAESRRRVGLAGEQ
jgi:hypothetical protein